MAIRRGFRIRGFTVSCLSCCDCPFPYWLLPFTNFLAAMLLEHLDEERLWVPCPWQTTCSADTTLSASLDAVLIRGFCRPCHDRHA